MLITQLQLSCSIIKLNNLLQNIDELDDNDKTEALGYIRKFIQTKPSCSQQPTIENAPENVTLEQNAKLRIKVREPLIRKNDKTCLFKCTICDETKGTRQKLLTHMEISHIGTPISCITCRRTLNSRAAYEWHINHLCRKRRHFSNGQFKCPECLKLFTLQRTYNIHMKAHKRNNCSLCKVVLTKHVHLVEHMLDIHNIKLKKKSFNCFHCQKSFTKRCDLYHHLQQHFPLKIVCGQCGHINNSKEEHDQHLQKHGKKGHWECFYCSDRFSRRQQYFHHMKNHDRYKCLTCNKTFASKEKIYLHKKQGHTVQGLEPQFHCPYCVASFRRSLLLQKHLISHTEKKTFILCKFCDKRFSTERQYFKHCNTANHNKKHPEITNCLCAYCGKIFTHNYKLNNHLRYYHGCKSQCFSCLHCEFQTQFKANFKRHLNLHFNEENTFICDYCGKNLSTMAVLIDHIRYNHVQEKKFKCDECNYSFKRKNEIVRHIATHSNLRPHVCKVCDRGFKRLNHLHRHESTVHSIASKTNRVQRLKTDDGIVNGRVDKSNTENEEISVANNDGAVTSTISNLKPVEYYFITIPERETYISTLNQVPSTNDLQTCTSVNELLISLSKDTHVKP